MPTQASQFSGKRRRSTRRCASVSKRGGVLAAPDIDTDVFWQLAATFPSAATHVTLYASTHDEALAASARVHSYYRAGDARHICVVAHVDTIDASAVDTSLLGHAYYGDNRSIEQLQEFLVGDDETFGKTRAREALLVAHLGAPDADHIMAAAGHLVECRCHKSA